MLHHSNMYQVNRVKLNRLMKKYVQTKKAKFSVKLILVQRR